MAEHVDLKGLNARIKAMKNSAEELKSMAGEFPALNRNVSRALASIKMMELNLTDLLDEELLP